MCFFTINFIPRWHFKLCEPETVYGFSNSKTCRLGFTFSLLMTTMFPFLTCADHDQPAFCVHSDHDLPC